MKPPELNLVDFGTSINMQNKVEISKLLIKTKKDRKIAEKIHLDFSEVLIYLWPSF